MNQEIIEFSERFVKKFPQTGEELITSVNEFAGFRKVTLPFTISITNEPPGSDDIKTDHAYKAMVACVRGYSLQSENMRKATEGAVLEYVRRAMKSNDILAYINTQALTVDIVRYGQRQGKLVIKVTFNKTVDALIFCLSIAGVTTLEGLTAERLIEYVGPVLYTIFETNPRAHDI